jgi:hypothetical protein
LGFKPATFQLVVSAVLYNRLHRKLKIEGGVGANTQTQHSNAISNLETLMELQSPIADAQK